jgi:hypothetical protein
MRATTQGVEFDPDKSWDEKLEIWRISNKIATSKSITQTAVGDKKGLRTTVVTGAIFIPEPLFSHPVRKTDGSVGQSPYRSSNYRSSTAIWRRVRVSFLNRITASMTNQILKTKIQPPTTVSIT